MAGIRAAKVGGAGTTQGRRPAPAPTCTLCDPSARLETKLPPHPGPGSFSNRLHIPTCQSSPKSAALHNRTSQSTDLRSLLVTRVAAHWLFAMQTASTHQQVGAAGRQRNLSTGWVVRRSPRTCPRHLCSSSKSSGGGAPRQQQLGLHPQQQRLAVVAHSSPPEGLHRPIHEMLVRACSQCDGLGACLLLCMQHVQVVATRPSSTVPQPIPLCCPGQNRLHRRDAAANQARQVPVERLQALGELPGVATQVMPARSRGLARMRRWVANATGLLTPPNADRRRQDLCRAHRHHLRPGRGQGGRGPARPRRLLHLRGPGLPQVRLR